MKKIYSKLPVFTFLRFAIFTWALAFGFIGTCRAADGVLPFKPGEKLNFVLKWGFIPAGTATLEVMPMEQIGGNEAYHFVLTATSNSFVDIFYKVRDRIDSYADQGMNHSVLYKKRQREGSTVKDIVVTFDWEKGEAFYSNFGRDKKSTKLLPGAFDPLSIFYYVRQCDLELNKEIEQPVSDGEKTVIGRTRVVRRKTLKLESGKYDALLIEPELKHIGGVFEKSKNAKIEIWLTGDSRKIPVKLKSKVVVGSFTAELVSFEHGG